MSKRIQQLEIPDEEQGTLAAIARFTDPTLQELESALSELTPTLLREDLVAQLRRNPLLATVPDLEGILGTLISIAGTASAAGIDTSEVVEAAVQAIKNDDVIDLSDEDAEALKKRLISLEKQTSLALVAKASELLKANERVLHSVKVISDLRPICLGKETNVGGAVIVHQLAIRSTRNGRREHTYFAMDSPDLNDLKDAVAAAIRQDGALRELAACSKLPVLSPPVE